MKHVCVTIDSREKTASRKNDATDLLSLWSGKEHQNYQVATAALNMGDVWISTSNEPIKIPRENQLQVTKGYDADIQSMNFFAVPVPSVESSIVSVPEEQDFPLPPKIVIERKSLADLESSYGDGRYREQKMRLINCDAEMVILLVEGYESAKIKEEVRKKKFLSTFVHSMFRDGIYVYHTRNIQESFEWIEWIANEMALGKLEHTQEYLARTKYTDNIQMNKKANLTPERGLEMQLASIPGISAKMARAVSEKYKSMQALCDAYRELPSEKERQNLLANLSFRGPSGKDQRLATRSAKIYLYLQGGVPPPLKPLAAVVSVEQETRKKKRAKVSDNKILAL